MFLASSSYGVKLHRCEKYEEAYAYETSESGPIQTISWSCDGSLLSAISCNGSLEILHIQNDALCLYDKIISYNLPTTAIFQRTMEKKLAIATYSHGIYIYDTESHSIEKEIDTNGQRMNLLEWNMSDSYLAAAEYNGQISIYNVASNKKSTSVFIPASKIVSALKYHPKISHNLCCASDEGPVVVWDINTRKTLYYSDAHKAAVTGVAFSKLTTNFLLSVGLDKCFIACDMVAGNIIIDFMLDQPISAMDVAPDGHTVALASPKGALYIYDLRQFKTHTKKIMIHDFEVKSLSFQPLWNNTETVKEVSSCYVIDDQDSHKELHSKIFSGTSVSEDDSVNQNEYLVNTNEMTDYIWTGKTRENVYYSPNSVVESNLEHLPSTSVKKGMKSSRPTTAKQLSNYNKDHNDTILHTSQYNAASPHTDFSATPSYSLNVVSHASPTADVSLNTSPKPGTSHFARNYIARKEFKKIVKQTVSKLVSKKMSTLNENMNRYFVNFELLFSKQFVDQETYFRDFIQENYAGHEDLKANIRLLEEQNEILKKEIAKLQENNNS